MRAYDVVLEWFDSEDGKWCPNFERVVVFVNGGAEKAIAAAKRKRRGSQWRVESVRFVIGDNT